MCLFALDSSEVVLEPPEGRLVSLWSGGLGTCTGREAAQELGVGGGRSTCLCWEQSEPSGRRWQGICMGLWLLSM